MTGMKAWILQTVLVLQVSLDERLSNLIVAVVLVHRSRKLFVNRANMCHVHVSLITRTHSCMDALGIFEPALL